MPPQIKQDLNRSGWETTDFPSVCENCLPDNPYVQMLKEDFGQECKLQVPPVPSVAFFLMLIPMYSGVQGRLRHSAGKQIEHPGRSEQTSA
jgi:hypothetical protein